MFNLKIISLCPSNTELCTYLGIEDRLIAIDDYSDWPETIQHLPKVGPDLSIDIDHVESLKPDLVLASLSVPGMEKNIEGLKERNIPHIIFNPQSLEDIAKDLLTLGKAMDLKEKAEEQAAKFRDAILQYKNIADKIETKPSLYWEWWPNPLFSPGELIGYPRSVRLREDITFSKISTWQAFKLLPKRSKKRIPTIFA